MNNYKLATIFLAILCLALIGSMYYESQENEIYDFNGLKIKKDNLKAITDPIETNQFLLCGIKEGGCVEINRLNTEHETLNG